VREFPAFQEVYDKHQGKFELLSIAVDERADPRALVQQNGYTWTFGLSEQGPAAYNFTAIPTTIFIDKNGNVVDQHTGGMDAADFERRLSQIL
jgi:thioredoxin-related protein